MTTLEDLFTRVYPGASVQINDEIIEIKQISYTWVSDNLQVRINEHSHRKKIIYVEGKIICDDNEVQLLSSPHTDLIDAWKYIPFSKLFAFMSFIYKDRELRNETYLFSSVEFSKVLSDQWNIFEYFRSTNQKNYLMKHLGSAFVENLPHSDKCAKHNQGLTFDGDHVCDEIRHLCCLLEIAFNKKITIHETEGNCLGAVVILRETPQFIHITPNGFFISGTYGQGTCRHPLTRLIFWKCLLVKVPKYTMFFQQYHHQRLLIDLCQHGFITPVTNLNLDQMISRFNTSICVKCRKDSKSLIRREIRTWHNTYNYIRCNCNSDYEYHLTLLAVLRNGWNGSIHSGSTVLDYHGEESIVYYKSDTKDGTLSFLQVSHYVYFIRAAFGTFLTNMIDHLPPYNGENFNSDDDFDENDIPSLEKNY
ncbi:Hypothetical protein HVR_LOCUS1111 [uncultured virus]|nr:Hypothetical protein HVR_LOCUS1111 [uncultured virus]